MTRSRGVAERQGRPSYAVRGFRVAGDRRIPEASGSGGRQRPGKPKGVARERDSLGDTRDRCRRCYLAAAAVSAGVAAAAVSAATEDVVSAGAAVVSDVVSAFLPQPTATNARASAISARAKSLRIVCTFTSSHAATPRHSPGSSRVLSRKSLWNGTQEKTPLGDASGVGQAASMRICGCDRGRGGSLAGRTPHQIAPQARVRIPGCQTSGGVRHPPGERLRRSLTFP